MCRNCKVGKSVAALNGLCETCWDNVFGHPSWKSDKRYVVNYNEDGSIKMEMWL